MQYKLNDLLEDADVAALTAETFGVNPKPRRVWRRLATLAACAVLAVGVFNFGAIATGVKSLWSYFVGVGAVAPGSRVLVQEKDIVWELEGRTFTLGGAYERDGVVSLHVFLRTDMEVNGDAWFDITLLEDGEPCQTVWGDAAERGTTPFWTQEQWAAEAEKDAGGYLMPERYKGGGSFAGLSPSFTTKGSGSYTVELWQRDKADRRVGKPLTAELKLQTPEAQSFQEYSIPQDGGTLTALVGERGRRVSFSLDGADGGLSLRCPYDIWFVDEAGNRCRGAMISGPATLPSQSVEVRLETEPEAPIVSIEIGSLLLMRFDSAGAYLGYEERPDLDWTIPVES